jgi:hypothetical protein
MAPKGKIEPLTCPLCGFQSKMKHKFEDHVNKEHNTTAQQLWVSLHPGKDVCKCGCGSKTTWLGWKDGHAELLRGHNANLSALYSPEQAREIVEKRASKIRGKPGFWKGKTKENDEATRLRAEATSRGRKKAFDEGKLTAWNKGSTKSSDERVAKAAADIKERFAKGICIPWAKGLSKNTDSRIARMSSKISLTMRRNDIRTRLDNLKRLRTDEIVSHIQKNGNLEVVGGLENYISDASKVIDVKCKTCGSEFTSSLRLLQHGRCWICSPAGSAAQEQIACYVASLVGNPNIIRNDRKTFSNRIELDIFVPHKNFAIEYNGLYWHCVYFKPTNYHQTKTTMCTEKSISLLHVFEDEWLNKRAIVQSTIKHRLGLTARKIGARKCNIVELSSAERRKFFQQNHLDGDTIATIAWGLKYNDEIVYALSLRKPFHKRYDSCIEVARSCSVLDTAVPGGLSRLTAHAMTWAKQHDYKKMMTYVDTRLGGSNNYQNAGFRLISTTTSRWWWTDFDNRYNRFKFKADSSRGMTEQQVADEAGVIKIWGCGNQLYELVL